MRVVMTAIMAGHMSDLVDEVSASDMIPGSSSNMLEIRMGELAEYMNQYEKESLVGVYYIHI